MPHLVLAGADIPLAGEIVLGRHRACGIRIADDAASRQHAKVSTADGLWWLEDLGSANGTRLNGTPIAGRKRLRDRDTIAIGKVVVRFVEDDIAVAPVVAAVAGASAGPGSARLESLTGTTIAGYRLDAFLGRGMLGVVYRAHQLNLDRTVAFKIFDPDRCTRDAGLAKRFLVESGKVGSLTHDALVQLHESGSHEGLLWCSMEWVEGETLDHILARDKRVAPSLTLLIIETVAEGLRHAHDHGVIHGDLRPSHVLLMGDGRIKLTDIGMMGIFEEGELPATPASLAWYLSPEQAAEGASDPRSDAYSLGCVLFHLLTGRPPYEGPDTAAVIAAHGAQAIPSVAGLGIAIDAAKVDALLQSLLAKNPAWRHASMVEVLTEVRPLRETSGPRPLPRRSGESAAVRLVQRTREPLLKRLMVPLLVVVLLAIGVAIVLPQLGARTAAPPASAAQTALAERPASIATPSPVSPPRQLPPTPGFTAAVAPAPPRSPAAVAWSAVQATIDQLVARGDWVAAEQALNAFRPTVANEPLLTQQVEQRHQQLLQDNDAWYQQALAALPAGETPSDLAKRFRGLGTLRDAVLGDDRADAGSRYQEALTKLGQRLNAAKRQARQAVENGRVLDLPRIAGELAPVFAGTPVADLHRQFALLCNEAAGIKPLWSTSWEVTRSRLLAATGADALAAAAALLLTGGTAEAKALMANDPALAGGELLRRREALIGRRAAVLAFTDPDDLQYIEVITGEPRMAAGHLSGAPGEGIALACAAPIGRIGWDVALNLAVARQEPDGEAVVSLAVGENADVQVRIEEEAIVARLHSAAGWRETQVPRVASEPVRLRIAERGGTVSVYRNDQLVIGLAAAIVAPGSVLRFEAAGVTWSIDDLQVVGGE